MSEILKSDFAVSRKVESANILKRIAAGERSAVEDCVNLYGNRIWKIVENSVAAVNDAEDITLEIFGDIWKRAADFEANDLEEADFINSIIHHRLTAYRERDLLCSSRIH